MLGMDNTRWDDVIILYIYITSQWVVDMWRRIR